MKFLLSYKLDLMMDILFKMNKFYPLIKFFIEDNKRDSFSVWISLRSKGNLWKIRAFTSQRFRVYYGTKIICATTDLDSAIKYVNKEEATEMYNELSKFIVVTKEQIIDLYNFKP